jgi:hypothetical protein
MNITGEANDMMTAIGKINVSFSAPKRSSSNCSLDSEGNEVKK